MARATPTSGSAEKRLQTRLRSLQREMADIELEYLSNPQAPLKEQVWLAQTRRNTLTRGIIIEIHLSIDDLITSHLRERLLAFTISEERRNRMRRFHSNYTPYIDEFLNGRGAIYFRQKIILMRAIGAIAPSVFRELEKLNQIRNSCSHNWLLSIKRRRGIKRTKKKRPVLEYEGKNLYERDNLKAFIWKYTRLYLRLYMKFG